jgi:hypothetical protein
MAPYTSIVTSSMMGKSRLVKEIAKWIPTVYLSLRESKERAQQVDGERFVDGYPDRSPDNVIKYLFYDAPNDGGEKDLERYYICFLIGILESFAIWFGTVLESSETTASSNGYNKRLWNMLAEPSKLSGGDVPTSQQSSQGYREGPTTFWGDVIRNARWHYKNSSDLKSVMQDNWQNLTEILQELNLLDEQPVPLLLLVFDEARALVKRGPRGKRCKMTKKFPGSVSSGEPFEKWANSIKISTFSQSLQTPRPKSAIFNQAAFRVRYMSFRQ